jgi:Domain of unknown function (DUF932)
LREARTALGLSWRYIEEFEAQAAALYAAPMDVDEVRDFATELVKMDQADTTATRNRRGVQASAQGQAPGMAIGVLPDRS